MRISGVIPLVSACALAFPMACAKPPEPTADEPRAGAGAMSLNVRSPAFEESHAIPKRFTEDGEDLSIELTWSQLPPDTKELALIVDDPDAPRAEPWVHWLIYGIPAATTKLTEGIPPVPRPSSPTGSIQGKNSWGTTGYRGPAPPRGHGTHHYHFKLYALDSVLGLEPGLDKHELMAALSGHILAHGELVGTYQR